MKGPGCGTLRAVLRFCHGCGRGESRIICLMTSLCHFVPARAPGACCCCRGLRSSCWHERRLSVLRHLSSLELPGNIDFHRIAPMAAYFGTPARRATWGTGICPCGEVDRLRQPARKAADSLRCVIGTKVALHSCLTVALGVLRFHTY